jgi:hypothetical protein
MLSSSEMYTCHSTCPTERVSLITEMASPSHGGASSSEPEADSATDSAESAAAESAVASAAAESVAAESAVAESTAAAAAAAAAVAARDSSLAERSS